MATVVDDEYVAFLTALTKSDNPVHRAQAMAELLKVGPKGYEHGWRFVGVPIAGALVHHPEHGSGRVARVSSRTAGVHFDSGHYAAFEHGAESPEMKPLTATIGDGTHGFTASHLEEMARNERVQARLRSTRRPDRGKAPGPAWHAQQEAMQGHYDRAAEMERLAVGLREQEAGRQPERFVPRGTMFASPAELKAPARKRTPAKAAPKPAPERDKLTSGPAYRDMAHAEATLEQARQQHGEEAPETQASTREAEAAGRRARIEARNRPKSSADRQFEAREAARRWSGNPYLRLSPTERLTDEDWAGISHEDKERIREATQRLHDRGVKNGNEPEVVERAKALLDRFGKPDAEGEAVRQQAVADAQRAVARMREDPLSPMGVLGSPKKRAEYMRQHANMTRDEFDALPQDKKDQHLAHLRIIAETKDPKRAYRDSMGSLVRGGYADHVSGAQSQRSYLMRPLPAKVDKTPAGVVARMRAAKTEEEMRGILESAGAGGRNTSKAELEAIASEGGWHTALSSGLTHSKMNERIMNEAAAHHRTPAAVLGRMTDREWQKLETDYAKLTPAMRKRMLAQLDEGAATATSDAVRNRATALRDKLSGPKPRVTKPKPVKTVPSPLIGTGSKRPRSEYYNGRKLEVKRGREWGTLDLAVNGQHVGSSSSGSGPEHMDKELLGLRRQVDAMDRRREEDGHTEAYGEKMYEGAGPVSPEAAAAGAVRAARERADRVAIATPTPGSFEARTAALKPFTQPGPDYNRGVADELRSAYAQHGKGDDPEMFLLRAEIHAGMRPESDWDKWNAAQPKTAPINYGTPTVPAVTPTVDKPPVIAGDPGPHYKTLSERVKAPQAKQVIAEMRERGYMPVTTGRYSKNEWRSPTGRSIYIRNDSGTLRLAVNGPTDEVTLAEALRHVQGGVARPFTYTPPWMPSKAKPRPIPQTRGGYKEPSDLEPGAAVTWSHKPEGGRSYERTGRVWSAAPTHDAAAWVIPDEHLPTDPYHAIAIHGNKTDGTYYSGDADPISVSAGRLAARQRANKSADWQPTDADLNLILRAAGYVWKAQQCDLLVKVGPKGYEHGWRFVGVPAVGAVVHHPEHGTGTVTRSNKKTAAVRFESGHEASFEHGAEKPSKYSRRQFTPRGKPKTSKKPKKYSRTAPADEAETNRVVAQAEIHTRLASASVDQLTDAFHNISQQPAGPGRDRALRELDAELARRENLPHLDVTDDEQSRKIDELVARGYSYTDAYAEAHNVDPTKLARQERVALIDAQRHDGERRDQTLRRMYSEHVARQYLDAETVTRGNVLTAVGQRKGVEPMSLWSGNPAVARKYASDELKQWWEDHGGRQTWTQFRTQYLGTGRQEAEASRLAGAGRDYGL